jgi:hypothetical protein
VDEGENHAHIFVNEGDTDLVLADFRFLPAADRRVGPVTRLGPQVGNEVACGVLTAKGAPASR